MKRIIIILFILLLVGCSGDKEETKPENINIDDKIEAISDRGITIELDKFYYQDGYSTINLNITNNNDYTVYIGKYKVYVYDREDNLIGTFNPIFNASIRGGEKLSQMFSTEKDYSKAYRIEYELEEIEKVDY